jgi:hypothetical protein
VLSGSETIEIKPVSRDITTSLTISHCLRAPVLALTCDVEERSKLENLPAAIVVTIASEVHDSGLVDVRYRDTIYTVFFTDLCERGELAEGRHAG